MHGHNGSFTGDPFQYVSRYAINHLAMKVYGEKDAYDFDDKPRFDERGRALPGAYSAYNDRVNQAKAAIPFVDLPKTAPAHRLMLTGAMNGCSLVVTQHPGDPTRLRVYHDSCHGVDTFKDDIVYARIDYEDEGYASANGRAGPARARSASVGGPVAPPAPRARSASVGGDAPARAGQPIACVRSAYGDAAQYEQVHAGSAVSGISNTDVQVRTSFNFLWFDAAVGKWTAISQPLETQAASAQPVRAWYETADKFTARQKAFRRKGTQVLMPPARAPWRAVIPY